MDLKILTKDEVFLTLLSNTIPDACRFYDDWMEEELNGKVVFEFSVPMSHPDSEHVVEDNIVAFIDHEENWQAFTIVEVVDEHGDGLFKKAYGEHVIQNELLDDYIGDYRPENRTVAEVMTTILSGTRIQVGTMASLGTQSTTFYEITLKECVTKVTQIWGGEVRYRLVLNSQNKFNRYLDLLPSRGTNNGKRFEYKKDIQTIKRTAEIKELKTALIGRGKGEETGDGYGRRINFSDVVWSVANGDPVDKPAGQDWVGDPTALAQWGRLNSDGTRRHRFGRYEETEQTDPIKLLENTWKKLQVAKKPLVSYEMIIFDLYQLLGIDYEHEKISLGDTTAAIDYEFKPTLALEVRIVGLKRQVSNPENGTVTLGNFLPLFTDDGKRIEELERTVNDNRGTWESNPPPVITDDNFPDTVPLAPANASASGLFKAIQVKWDFENKSYIANYEVYASKIANFTPSLTNLKWKGLSGGMSFDAATDEQWYIRIRAVNTHGTAGPFTAQLTATTARVAGGDIAPQTITNELIADTAAIDFAKIAKVLITNAMINNFVWDKGEGGTIKLGTSYADGDLKVWADNNGDGIPDIVGSIDVFGAYFPSLQGDRIIGNIENRWMLGNKSYYFDSDTGSDDNDGLSWTTAKKNPQIFINELPKNLDGSTLKLYMKGTFYNWLTLVGFRNGHIDILGDSSRPKLYGRVIFENCVGGNFLVQNIDANGDQTTGGHPLFTAINCDAVVFYACKVYGNNLASHGFWMEGSRFRIEECHVYDIGDRGLFATNMSVGYVGNCKGTAPIAILCNISVVMGSGTRWAGSIVRWNGHVGSINSSNVWVIDVWTVNYGEVAPPPPPPSQEQTLSVAPGTGDNWSTSGYWTNDEVKQGNWGYGDRYGIWYMDLSALRGKTIVQATITVYRNSGGTSDGRTIYFRTHPYTSRAARPAGAPAMSGAYLRGPIEVGQTLTFDITDIIQNNIANFTDTSIGVHTTGSTDYMSLGTTPTLNIRYK